MLVNPAAARQSPATILHSILIASRRPIAYQAGVIRKMPVMLQSAFAMLCVALALVASASSLTRSLDQIEHAPGRAIEHAHGAIAQVSLEHDHHADDSTTDASLNAAEEPASGHVGSHHHHYGDTGGALLLVSGALPVAFFAAGSQIAAEQNPPVGHDPFGADRPPRQLLNQA